MPDGAIRILLVEDHEPNVMIATMFFEQLGYEYVVASTGPEALKVFTTFPPFSLIMLDLQLPEMDGVAVAKQIREHEKVRNITAVPILAVTGNATEDDRIICLKAGMNDYMSKPYRLDDLSKKLNSLFIE